MKDRIVLTKPTPDHKEVVLAYRQAFIKSGDSMDGTSGLKDAITYEVWYDALQKNSREETVADGFVPATCYLAIDKFSGQLVGMLDIRHRLNDHLLQFGGHIGYSVVKAQRQKGYAREILSKALKVCGEMGLSKVLVTCDKENIASARTILGNGGVLENEVEKENAVTQRYWITL